MVKFLRQKLFLMVWMIIKIYCRMVNIKHLSASPVGMTITCKTELVDIDRRRLVFHVECYDTAGLIGEGDHERFIIDEAKFMAKTDGKLQ